MERKEIEKTVGRYTARELNKIMHQLYVNHVKTYAVIVQPNER